MRVEIVEEAEVKSPASVFPPGEKYFDLRANPQAIERIAGARQYLPLRNFLASVNSEESIFATAGATTKSEMPATVSADLAHEFASQARIVFAENSLNWERRHYVDLRSGLKELLERDAADAVRAVLRISSCDFTAERRPGFWRPLPQFAVPPRGSPGRDAALRPMGEGSWVRGRDLTARPQF